MAQKKLTHQIVQHWHPFKDLKQTFVVSRRAEHLCLPTHQCVVVTVEDSVLCVEMGALESQEEDAPKRILWYKPLDFLLWYKPLGNQVASSDETWSTSL